jgi:hypothetical protein
MWLLFVKLMSPLPWWLDGKLQPTPVLPAKGNVTTSQNTNLSR